MTGIMIKHLSVWFVWIRCEVISDVAPDWCACLDADVVTEYFIIWRIFHSADVNSVCWKKAKESFTSLVETRFWEE